MTFLKVFTMNSLRRRINQIKGFSNYFSVSKVYSNKTMFKYMNLETALISLENGSIRFSEPDVWRDSFESRFYSADYCNIKHCPAKDTPKLYACCFTYKKVSEAAWTTYNANQKGLGAKCVQFVINVDAFRKELTKTLSTNDNIYEGRIDYTIGDSIISQLHTVNSPYYNELRTKFGLEMFLSLMLIKRNSFAHEQELRIFINKDNDNTKCKSSLDIPINWVNVIEKIYLAEDVSKMEMKIVVDMCKAKGININLISKQAIYGKSSGKQIVFSK